VDNIARHLLLLCTLLVGLLLLSSLSSAADFDAWCVPQSVKIFRSTPPKALRSAFLVQAGRNEWVAWQVVVRALEAPLSKVEVSVSDFLGPAGARLPGSSFDLYTESYIYLPALKREYPDPLPPYKPFAVQPRTNQPVWVEAFIPRHSRPGYYRGKVTVSCGAISVELPIRLHIWDVELPTVPTSNSAFGLYYNVASDFEGVERGSEADKKLRDLYYWILVEHRLSPYDPPATPGTPEAVHYLKDPRVRSYRIPYSDDEQRLKATIEALRAQGILEKGYFYVVDEPVKEAQFKRLIEVADKIHKLYPKARLVSPYYRFPDFTKEPIYSLLAGKVNIWCPETVVHQPEPLAAKQAAGEEVWWYVCCGPGAPYANMFVNMAAATHRVLEWQQALRGVQGLLYWASNYWKRTKDPWQDIATVPHISPNIYGDGSVLYPGKPVGHFGPVASIRLKMLRAGMYDYDLLTRLAKTTSLDHVKEVALPVTRDLTHFTKSGWVIERTRARLLRELESQS